MGLTVGRGYDENADDALIAGRTLTLVDPSEQRVTLAEPARQRLVQLAAEVVGRLPAEEVPPALRAVARFTPAKRARLGSVALAASLDSDSQLRERVAEVVADALPQLAELVQHGASTAASDPIDVAVVAYLLRPDDWAQVVADANARWSADHASRQEGTNSTESRRLRDEVMQLRSQAKAAGARSRAATEAACADVRAEAEQLRRTLRVRIGELRAAERARDDALAGTAQALDSAAAAAASHESELQAMRARVTELERGVESARRDTRRERDHDEARLRMLLDTLASAAAGLRRELALPAGTFRPADAVAQPLNQEPNRSAGDVVTLDRLLELPQLHVIVDGYNVTKTAYPDLALIDQRNRLITSTAALQARTGVELTIAFDGSARPPSQPRAPRGIRVLFSAAHESADDLIRRVVAAEPAGRALLVVTTDGQIVSDVRASGAWTVPSALFAARLG